MRTRPAALLALACLAAAAALTGCGGDEPARTDRADPAGERIQVDPGPPPSPSAVPAPAEGSGAQVLQDLSTGRATGSVLITYQGLGELRAPFSGECAHDGPTTEFRGTADGAEIVLAFGPDGARLTVDDVGLQSTAALAAGDIAVDDDRVTLEAPLLEGGLVIGTVHLDADCGA